MIPYNGLIVCKWTEAFKYSKLCLLKVINAFAVPGTHAGNFIEFKPWPFKEVHEYLII